MIKGTQPASCVTRLDAIRAGRDARRLEWIVAAEAALRSVHPLVDAGWPDQDALLARVAETAEQLATLRGELERRRSPRAAC